MFVALVTIAHGQAPTLEFLTPTNNAVYSGGDTIPLVLRAIASNDAFLTADVFANSVKVATVSYCCPACPCFLPRPGDETRLQYPVPSNGTSGHGWTNAQPGTYRLTARAVGQHDTLDAPAITVSVVDRRLEIYPDANGRIILRIPFGAMVTGGYDLEISEDLRTWTRLGSFGPGNVAAFYWDDPPPEVRVRFYRSVYTPQNRR